MSEKAAILSDVHGNSPALKAVLEDIHNVGCTRLFVLGDVINGIDPDGCLDLLKAWGNVVCLKGNAESYLLTPDLDRFPQREEPLYRNVIRLLCWWQAHISDANMAWIQSMPDLVLWDDSCLVHDSPLDRAFPQNWKIPGVDDKYQELCHHAKGITQNMPAKEMAALSSFMDEKKLSRVFCGHTHKSFVQRMGQKLICNAGSVGMPMDGDPRPSWVMVGGAEGRRVVTIRRVSYDIDQILQMIDEVLDYPGFDNPDRRDAYKVRFITGSIPD